MSPYGKRLSDAFSEFDAYAYQRIVADFERGVEAWNQQQADPGANLLDLRPELPGHLEAVLRHIWPDMGGSYFVGSTLPGIAPASQVSLQAELSDLYERFVSSQYNDARRPKRDDSDVWNVYRNALGHEYFGVTAHLKPVEIRVGDFHLDLPHTFKNSALHILKPVSLDYASRTSIRNKVKELLGEAQLLLQSDTNIAKMYLLLGRPANPALDEAYQTAKRTLDTLLIDHDIVEEKDAERFARQVIDIMRQHGLLPDDTTNAENFDIAA